MKIEIHSDSFDIYDVLDTIAHMQLHIMTSIDDFNGELLSQTYKCLTYARLMRLIIRKLPGDHSEELEQINQKSKLLQL